jgi:hypothetical protein
VHENGVEMKLAVRKTMALMQFTKRATQSAGASSEERKANGSHKAWDRVARVVQAPVGKLCFLEKRRGGLLRFGIGVSPSGQHGVCDDACTHAIVIAG